MTLIKKYDLNCKCGYKFKAFLYDSINITLDPTLLKKLFDGIINVVECPKCHTKSFVNKHLIFHDLNKGLMIKVKEGEIKGLMHFLDSKGYFDKFKKQKK